jgi:methionyl-tRNA formyltransferase
MNVVFITHNEVGLACLTELNKLGANIQAVYTRDRNEEISDQAELEAFTEQANVPLHRVDSVNTDTVKSQIKQYAPDMLFVIGWSRLVEQDVLRIPSVTAVGMHPAPLPKGRGRAPIAWSLIKGLEETALSFFHLVEQADAGDIIGQKRVPIKMSDDAASLYAKIVDAAGELIQQYYPRFEAGIVPREPQDETQATWWPKREPHHGLIEWTKPSQEIYNWIRGQTKPYPGAFSYLNDRKVTIWSANPPTDSTAFISPGEIAYVDSEAVGVGTWEGIIELTEIQVEDDASISADNLVSAYEFEVGDVFENARDRLERKK